MWKPLCRKRKTGSLHFCQISSGGRCFHSFLPPLILAHWEPNTEHSDSYPPGAHVHQEAGWTESGLRTRLQIFNHRSLSSLSPPPSSARYQLSPVLTQLIPLPTLFSSWNKIISESHSLLVISIMQLFFCWFFPQSSPTSLTPPQDTPSRSPYSPSESVHKLNTPPCPLSPHRPSGSPAPKSMLPRRPMPGRPEYWPHPPF